MNGLSVCSHPVLAHQSLPWPASFSEEQKKNYHIQRIEGIFIAHFIKRWKTFVDDRPGALGLLEINEDGARLMRGANYLSGMKHAIFCGSPGAFKKRGQMKLGSNPRSLQKTGTEFINEEEGEEKGRRGGGGIKRLCYRFGES